MPTMIQRSVKRRSIPSQVTPSIIDPKTSSRFTLDQELEPFGKWVGDPIWVPPKDSSRAMAQSMLKGSSLLASKDKRWSSVTDEHRSDFTQVREFEMAKASIRLPQGKFFVAVTEQENFDKITDSIPACVQTRLDEFMAGPAKQRGVKVYYLKPLCVEIGDDLIFTTREDLMAAVTKIQSEVFSDYRNQYLSRLPRQLAVGAANLAMGIPRRVVSHYVRQRKKAIDDCHARLEFKRRKTALRAARTHRRFRSDGCTFDDMLALTNPLERADVIE